MSPKEIEANKVRAWKNRARGHPTRWRMLRDCVAVVSLGWMSTFQVQMAMRRLWALKNRTTRDLLEELESEVSICQEKDEREEPPMYKWGATREGVAFWIKDVQHIPAGIVEAVLTSQNVSGFEIEADRRIPGGPSA